MELSSETPLARFVYNDDDVYRDGRPRAKLFKPKKGDNLSVFDTGGMSHPEICEHGHVHADHPEIGRTHHGYAVVSYKAFVDNGLAGVYDNVPPRHVSIPYPGSDEQIREISKAIAARAVVTGCV